MNKSVIWTVGIQCKADEEVKFNTWYDDIHVPMLLKGDFVKKVARFKLADATYHVGTTTQTCPNYLTIYEFESHEKFDAWMNSPARAEAGDDKAKTWGDTGYELKWAALYNLISAWNVQKIHKEPI
jgi:antibiotic biosynthesis monooxygenase (ABM) superfamily enzyme